MPRGLRIRTCAHCSRMIAYGNGQLRGRCCEGSRAALVQRRAYVLRRCHLASCACGDQLLLQGPPLRMVWSWSPCSRSFPCRSSSSGIASLLSRRRKTGQPRSLLARRSGRMSGLGYSSMCQISPDPTPPLAWRGICQPSLASMCSQQGRWKARQPLASPCTSILTCLGKRRIAGLRRRPGSCCSV